MATEVGTGLRSNARGVQVSRALCDWVSEMEEIQGTAGVQQA